MLQQDLLRAHPARCGSAGVCAAGHPLEAQAAVRILGDGGNAVDAAVAAAFVAAVVEPIDCGIGGYARISVGRVGSGPRFSIYDGYVRAPRRARPDMFTPASASTYYGHPATCHDAARHGPLAVAVPGAVAALCRAQAEHGRLRLPHVLAPAIETADRGVAFTWRDVLTIAELSDPIRRLPDTAAVLLPGGALPRLASQHPPEYFDTRALAGTLRRIAAGGPGAFHTGPVARELARYVRGLGGILDEQDLEAYRLGLVRERPGRYRDLEFVTCQDDVTHLALGLLDGFDLGAMPSHAAEHFHLVAESLGIAFTDVLAHFGDPEHVHAPVTALSGRAYARARRRDIRADGALSRPIAPGDPWRWQDESETGCRTVMGSVGGHRGTSQVVVADAEGTMVAICFSSGWNFGSLVYVPRLGFFLNDGMSYFDPRPGRPSSIAGRKMPLFGAPVLLAFRNGRPVLACTGSGGHRIASGVLHALVHVVDHGMAVDRALDHPRVACQGRETFVDARIDAVHRARLAQLGHDVVTVEDDVNTLHFGRIACVTHEPTGVLEASASPPWLTGVAASESR